MFVCLFLWKFLAPVFSSFPNNFVPAPRSNIMILAFDAIQIPTFYCFSSDRDAPIPTLERKGHQPLGKRDKLDGADPREVIIPTSPPMHAQIPNLHASEPAVPEADVPDPSSSSATGEAILSEEEKSRITIEQTISGIVGSFEGDEKSMLEELLSEGSAPKNKGNSSNSGQAE
jgi:hypothetical protein